VRFAAVFVSDAARLTLATIVANLVIVSALPLLSRLYQPLDFGNYGTVASVAAAAAGAAARLDLAMLSATSRRAVDRCFAAAVVFLPLSALVVALLGALVVPAAGGGMTASPAASAAAAIVTCAGVMQVLRCWRLARSEVRSAMGGTVANSTARTAAQLALPATGAAGLVIGECVGRIAGAIYLIYGRARRLRRVLQLVKRLPSTLRAHRHHIVYGVPSLIVDSLGYVVLVPAVAHAFGVAVAGLVAMAVRLLSLPSQMISCNVGDTLQRELALRAAGATGNCASLLRTSLWRLLGLGAVLVGPIALLAPWYVVPLLGDAWRGMISVMPWLGVQWVLGFAIAPLSRVLLVGDGQRQKLLYDLAAAALPAGLMLWAADRGLAHAIAAYSAGHVVAYALHLVLILRCAHRLDSAKV
jgi:O-antigen/teichoic acid export membrane protein